MKISYKIKYTGIFDRKNKQNNQKNNLNISLKFGQ